MTQLAATAWRVASEARPTVPRSLTLLAALLVPFVAAALLDRSLPGSSDVSEPEEELVCLMQRTLSLEHSSDGTKAPESKPKPEAPLPISPPDANAEKRDRLWHRAYGRLRSLEADGHHLGPDRTVRFTLAIFMAAAFMSAGLLCAQTRNGSWFLLALAATFPQERLRRQQEKFRMAKASKAAELARSEPEPLPLASMTPAALPTTAFSGSARCLESMAAGTCSELRLGNKLGNMVLCVTMKSVLPEVKVVTVEVEHEGGVRTPMASCFSEDGPVFEVRDAVGTFTGLLGPGLDSKGEPMDSAVRRHVLLRAAGGTALTLEGPPPDGRPRPSQGTLVARDPAGETLATLSLDEDDVQLTLKHSIMDSVVAVSIMGFYLLTV